jgi:hypothetical protein
MNEFLFIPKTSIMHYPFKTLLSIKFGDSVSILSSFLLQAIAEGYNPYFTVMYCVPVLKQATQVDPFKMTLCMLNNSKCNLSKRARCNPQASTKSHSDSVLETN